MSNYLTSIEWDLRRATTAKKELNKLFKVKEGAVKRAEAILAARNEELREVSLALSYVNQTVGELLGERFVYDEQADDWIKRHQ